MIFWMRNGIVTHLFFLLLLFPLCLFGQYRLTICAIFNNEAPFLKEWIEFHKMQGCEHFYLYNNGSTDNFLQVLHPYIRSGEVTLTEWSFTYPPQNHDEWLKIQCGAYKHCVACYGATSDWIAFIDVDEFLFCPSGQKLTRFLLNYTPYGAVGANWCMFGTSHVEKIPSKRCLIEVLTRCSSLQHPHNKSYKSIVQPKYIKDIHMPHSCVLVENFFTVDSDGKRVTTEYNSEDGPKYDKICLNHYWTRTEKFYRERKLNSEQKRGNVSNSPIVDSLNESCDTKILQFVPKLRKRLGLK
jgi:hypothetical protein